MSVFFDNSITENGRALWAEMQAGGTFTPTKIVMGKGYMPSGKTTRTMTAVAEVVKELSLNKKKALTDGAGDFVFGGVFNNQDISTAFYFRELALFAKVVRADQTETSEVLYSYGNAGDNAELIPAYSTGSVVERQIDIITYIGNDAQVDLSVASGVYVMHDEYDEDMEAVNEALSQHGTDIENLKKKKLSAHTNYYVDAVNGNDTTGDGTQANPYKTIVKTLSVIPKDLGGFTATVYIAAGTYNEDVIEVINFDSGRINLYGTLSQTTLNGRFTNINCSATVEFKDIIVNCTSSHNAIHIDRVSKCMLNNVIVNSAGIGVLTAAMSIVYGFSVTANNCSEAIRAESGSKISLQEVHGSGNYAILRASNGGVITVNTHDISGEVAHVTESGGRIYMGTQNNVPNY